MSAALPGVLIDEPAIASTLERHKMADAARVREVLAKARELNGLEAEEMAALMTISDPTLLGELFDGRPGRQDTPSTARRLVIFAPLYVSNLCGNECTYCAFRARNTELERRALTPGGDRPRGADAHRPGPQARAARGRRVVSARGVLATS